MGSYWERQRVRVTELLAAQRGRKLSSQLRGVGIFDHSLVSSSYINLSHLAWKRLNSYQRLASREAGWCNPS